jgi:clan AA aspartic protease
MGLVKVTARIGVTSDKSQQIEFMVDTGSFYTILPPETFNELGIEPRHRIRAVTADNRSRSIDLGSAEIEVQDRTAPVLVGRMPVPAPLLGASALEALGFKVNPVDETLEPTRPFPEVPVL